MIEFARVIVMCFGSMGAGACHVEAETESRFWTMSGCTKSAVVAAREAAGPDAAYSVGFCMKKEGAAKYAMDEARSMRKDGYKVTTKVNL